MKKRLIVVLSVITIFLAATTPMLAQGQNPITASVDRTTLTTDDVLTLTINVNTGSTNPPQPTLPALTGFNVLGTSTATQINMINGAISTRLSYSYQLQPTQAGQLIIDPITLTMNGQQYATQPITVQVTQGTGGPSPAPLSRQVVPGGSGFNGQKVYAEAEASKLGPFVGEPIVYTFRYYQALDMFDMILNQPQYTPPAFTGFWTEDQPNQNQYRVQANGNIYNVTELSTVLVPTKAGKITIEPASLEIPGGFFSRPSQLQSQPIVVDVKPLPAGAPASFSGAVGQFQLESSVDITQTNVNEPITWKVTLSGQGNVSTAGDPVWPDIPNWRSYQSKATTNAQAQNGQVVGTKTYERLLVPQTAGDFTIPALAYTYFDPASGTYQTISTQPVPVSVAPGAVGTASGQSSTLAPVDSSTTPPAPAADINYLKPVPGALHRGARPITSSPLYWIAWGIPLAALLGNLYWQRRQNFWANNASLVRSSQARQKAVQRLARAKKGGHDPYEAAGQALTDYLADKLNQPVVGLTRRALSNVLTEQGIRPELIERVNSCLAEAELGRYSPDAADPTYADNLLNEIEALVGDLEQAF